jgi:hypothetical protein
VSQESRPRFDLVVTIIIAGLVIGAAVFGSPYFIAAKTTTETVTVTSTSTTASTVSTVGNSTLSMNEGPLLYASGVSPQGLQLKVVLNSSQILSYGALGAQIEVFNTLGHNISSAVMENQNLSAWSGEDWVCGNNPSGSLVGFALFRGDFSADNISQAGPQLRLAPPFYPPCVEFGPPANVTFYPRSDKIDYALGLAEVNATSGECTGSGVGGHGGEISCGASPGLVGYWNDSISAAGTLDFSSPAFVYFPQGEYTIVAVDDWNQYVYANFVVA